MSNPIKLAHEQGVTDFNDGRECRVLELYSDQRTRASYVIGYFVTKWGMTDDETTAPASAWDEFMSGYNAAIKGADLMDMQTQDAVEGWWYARRPKEAGGITPDAEWIRNGC